MPSLSSDSTNIVQRIRSVITWKPHIITQLYERDADPRARLLAYAVLYPLMAYLCAVLTFIDATSRCNQPPYTIAITVDGALTESYTTCSTGNAATDRHARFAYSAPVPARLIPPHRSFYPVYLFFLAVHAWERPLGGRGRSRRLKFRCRMGIHVATALVVQHFLTLRLNRWGTLLFVVVPWKMLLESVMGTLLYACVGERALSGRSDTEGPVGAEGNGDQKDEGNAGPDESLGL